MDSRFLCQINAKADSDEAEILIYDEIGASWYGEGITAEGFVRDLAKLDAKTIRVRVNSGGGSVFEGLAIYNALRRHNAKIVTEIDGVAASIASVIALAGQEVRMADNAFLMIHNPHGVAVGNAADVRKFAELLETVGGSLAGIYVDRTGKDEETVQAWMDEETWFSAEEAKAAGFVHAITKGKTVRASMDPQAFRNAPAALTQPWADLAAAVRSDAAAAPSVWPDIATTIAAAGGHAAPETIPAPNSPAPKATEETMSVQDTAAQQPGAGTSTSADPVAQERLRVQQIRAIAKTHNVDAAKVDAWTDAGMTVAEVNAAILSDLRTRTEGSPNVRSTITVGAPRAEKDPKKGFESHKDFLLAAMADAGVRDRGQLADERLRPLAMFDKDDKNASGELAFLLPLAFTPGSILAAAGSDEQGTYSDRYGGFAVPSTLLPGLKTIPHDADPTAGRTQPLPMQTPTVEILARVDKDHSSSVSGGFTVTRRPETGAMTPSRMSIEKVTMKATSLFGLAYETEELLTDSPMSYAAIVATGFADQFPAHILNEKIRGTGVGEFLGVLNSDAKVQVAKETGQAADTIVANNIIKMAARSWGFGNAIWMANQDTRPQLAVLHIPVGTAGHLLYQPSQQEGFPDMLWGRPVFYNEYCSTVGDEGDLLLVNWSEYLEGLYQPLQSAESIHVRFLNHERTFKFWLRNAGAPWWRSALTPAKSTVTLSPIVTLAAR